MAVDQNVGDGGVLKQRLERPQPRHLVEDLGDEVVELLLIECQALDENVLRDQLGDVDADLVLGQPLHRLQVDLLDQPAMQPHLGVEQLVGKQRIRIRRLLRHRLGRRLRKNRPRHAFQRGCGLLDRHEFRGGRPSASGEPTGHSGLSILLLLGVACRPHS